MMNIYDFEVEKVNGETMKLSEYKGEVLLIVNSATRCGFTPQYDELQKIYETYHDRGFEVLEFPCNQFGHQAPESDEEIVKFCDAKFGLTFPHFAKLEVNGEHAHPLFSYLQKEQGFAGFDEGHPLTGLIEANIELLHPNFRNEPDIKWNFTKFIVDRNGNVVKRFEPTADMTDVEKYVESLL